MSLANKLIEERRQRLAAERLLELKQAELFAAHSKLGLQAQQLSEEIVETRAEVEVIRGENQRVKSDLSVAHKKIALVERRLWQSIETINDGFAFFNADNQMIMANRSYLAQFDGIEAVKPGVNYVTLLQIMTEEGLVDTSPLTPSDWRLMMTERLHDPSPDPIVIKLWHGGFVKLVNERGPGGDMMTLALDITETVRHEAQLKEARAIAESANRAKSAFLANMSHEIRTPMNGVVGMADLLSESNLTDEQRLYVDTIRNSGEALLVIINDVLDYSKIEAKKLDLHPESFDLERAIHEVMMLLQTSARDKGLTLLLDYDMFLPTQLIGDPGRIRQVLTNLAGNAIKFTSEGHVLIRVTGVPDPANASAAVHVSIEDTGIGIPANMIDQIFGEFNQVENERNRQFDGTGLGLAISQRLIELMDGQIWVTSEEGVGSCFGFKLDMQLAEPARPDQPVLPDGLRHVMIVDDIEITRQILERQLEQVGIKVTSCASGAEALERLSDDIDLVLTDHNMPQMDGLELCAALRSRGATVPTLLLSSSPAEARKDPNHQLLQGILQKPLPRENLLSQLKGLGFGGSAPVTLPVRRPLRLLAAEDNRTNQLVFRKMLKDLTLDLTFACDGEEAVQLYKACQPDLVFMDISMPRMDGKEATQAIRQIEKTSGGHVPIIALTAHAMNGDDAGILAAGLDHYMTKPLRKPLIIARIEEVWTPDMAPLHQPEDIQEAG